MMAFVHVVLAALIDSAAEGSQRSRLLELKSRLGLAAPRKQPSLWSRLSWVGDTYDRKRKMDVTGLLLTMGIQEEAYDRPHPISSYVPWIALQSDELWGSFRDIGGYVRLRELGDYLLGVEPNLEGVSVADALQASAAWHEELALRSGLPASSEGTELLHTFDDGWTIVRLVEPVAFLNEGNAMGNCLGSNREYLWNSQGGEYFAASLRDAKGRSRLSTWFTLPGTWGGPPGLEPIWKLRDASGKANTDPRLSHARRLRAWMDDEPSVLGAEVEASTVGLAEPEPFAVLGLFTADELLALAEEGDVSDPVEAHAMWAKALEGARTREQWSGAHYLEHATPGVRAVFTDPASWTKELDTTKWAKGILVKERRLPFFAIRLHLESLDLGVHPSSTDWYRHFPDGRLVLVLEILPAHIDFSTEEGLVRRVGWSPVGMEAFEKAFPEMPEPRAYGLRQWRISLGGDGEDVDALIAKLRNVLDTIGEPFLDSVEHGPFIAAVLENFRTLGPAADWPDPSYPP